MLTIEDDASFAQALASNINPLVKSLLRIRHDQLMRDTGDEYRIEQLARFVIVDPPDRLAEIEIAIGYPIFTERVLEWVQRHGSYYEAVAILDDSGFGVVAICPEHPDSDPALLSILRQEAQGSSEIGPPTH